MEELSVSEETAPSVKPMQLEISNLNSSIDGFTQIVEETIRKQAESDFDTLYPAIHFLSADNELITETPFPLLHELSKLPNVLKYPNYAPFIEEKREQLSAVDDSFEAVSKYIAENVTALSYFKSSLKSCFTKDSKQTPQKKQQIEDLSEFTKELLQKVQTVRQPYPRYPILVCLSQVVKGIEQVVEQINGLIQGSPDNEVSKQCVQELNDFLGITDNFLQAAKQNILMRDYLLKGLDFETVSKFRDTVFHFTMAAPHINRAFPELTITSLSSSLLFYVDNVLQTLSYTSTELNTPLDLAFSAKYAHIATDLLRESDIPFVTSVPESAEFLKSLSEFFKSFQGIIDPITTAGYIDSPKKVFNDIFNTLESLCTVLSPGQGYFQQCAVFERSILRFKKAIGDLIFSKKGRMKFTQSDALGHQFNYQPKFTQFSDYLLRQKDAIETNFISILGVYINPSKRSYSFSNIKQVELLLRYNQEKQNELFNNCLQVLDHSDKELDEIDGKSTQDFHKLVNISQELIKINPYVDMIKRQKETLSPEIKKATVLYHDVAHKLNDKLDDFVKECCQKIKERSLTELINILSLIIDSTLASANGSKEINQELTREYQETEERLKPIQEFLHQPENITNIRQLQSKLDDFKNSISITFKENKKKFDQANRDYYIRHLAKVVDDVIDGIEEQCKQFENKQYEVSDVAEPLREVEKDVAEVIDLVTSQNKQGLQSEIVYQLTNVLHTICLIETGLHFPQPNLMMKRLDLLEADLEQVWKTIKLLCPERHISKNINCFLQAKWRLRHLSSFFEHDEKLKEILETVNSNFKEIIQKDEKEDFKLFFESKSNSINEIIEQLVQQNGRTGEEIHQWAQTFSDMINDICNEWKPPRTVPFRDNYATSCEQLNAAIAELGRQPVKVIPFENPLDNLQQSQEAYADYLRAAGIKYGDKNYWAVVKDASYIQLPRDQDKLRAARSALLQFIDQDKENVEGPIKRVFAENLIFTLAAAKLHGYIKLKSFIETAIKFLNEEDIPTLSELSLNLLKNCNKILEILDPNEQLKTTLLQQFLLQSYLDPMANPVGLITLRTKRYGSSIKSDEENSKIFVSLTQELIKCFFKQKSPTELDYEQAIEHLRSKLPPELQLRKLSPEEEQNIIFNTQPLQIKEREVICNLTQEANPHLYLFNDWALDSAATSNKKVELNIMPPIQMTVYKDMPYNELNLPDTEYGHSTNYISTGMASELIIQCAQMTKPPQLNFNKLGQVYESMHKHSVIEGAPKSLYQNHFFHLKLDELLIEGKPLEGVIAMFYIYDFKLCTSITPPVFFVSDAQGKMKLLNDSEEAIFQINQPRNTTILICRLLHPAAIDTTGFNSYIYTAGKPPAPAVSPYNFAVSFIRLFNQQIKYNEGVKFPENFHLISNSEELVNDLDVFTGLNTPPTQKMKIQMELSHKYDDNIPKEVTFTWSNFKSPQVYIPSLLITQGNTLPLITLRNIIFSFKNPPKGKYCFFTAILAENDNDFSKVHGMECVLDYQSPVQRNEYRSTSIPTSTSCAFSDIVQFNIIKPLTSKAHIIIYFKTYDPGQAPKTYKVSVIPLYDNEIKSWISDINGEVSLFEPKKIDNKGYVTAKQPKANSKTKLLLTFPPLFFPHAKFSDVFLTKFNETTELQDLDVSGIKKQSLLTALVPISARLLKYVSPNTLRVLINFLSLFEVTDFLPRLRHWIYFNYDPQRMNENFIGRLIDSYRTFIEDNCSPQKPTQTGKQVHECINILKTMPTMCDLIAVTIAISAQEQPELLQQNNCENKFHNLCTAIGYFISRFFNLELCSYANHAFARMIFLVTPLWNCKTMLTIIQEYIEQIKTQNLVITDLTPLFPLNPDVKAKNYVPPPIPPPELSNLSSEVISLEFTLELHEIFFHTSNLIANVAFHNDGNFEIIQSFFDSMAKAFEFHDVRLIKLSIGMLAQLCRDLEQYETVAIKCAEVLYPYISLAIKYQDMDELKNNYALLQHFIVPILFLLHENDKELITKKFGSMDNEKKIQFFTFLENLVKAVLSPPSSKGTLGTIKQRTLSTEMKELQKMKTNSSDINYAIFNELSMRILDLMEKLIRAKADLMPAILPVTSLLLQLMNRHQTAATMEQVALIICHIIDYNQKHIFTNHNRFFEIIMNSAIRLSMRNLRKARAICVALVMHLFFVDYMCTKNIILSSHYFLDNFTTIVLEAPTHKLPIFGVILDKIKLFSDSFLLKGFIDLMTERLNASRIIYSSLKEMRSKNRSPEFLTQHIFTIANQFFTYPTLRLKWLKRAVDVNTKASIWSSVFVTQVRIASLCKIIIERMNIERLPHLDFSFVPSSEEEAQVNLEHANEKLRPLLVHDDDFSADGIIKALEGAVFSAKNNKLNRHLRFTLMQLVALYEMKREFKILVGTVNNLSQMYSALANETNEPLSFYLLEQRSNGTLKGRQIFASTISDLDKFVDWLNNPNDVRYEYGEQATGFSTIEEASKILTNICVFPLKAKHSLLKHDAETEFIFDEVGLRHTFTSSVPLPNSLACSNVAEYTKSELAEENKLIEVINTHAERVSHTTEMVRLMLPNKELASKKKPKLPLSNFTRQIDEASSPKFTEQVSHSASDENVKQAATELNKVLNEAMSVYIAAAQYENQESDIPRLTAQISKFGKVSKNKQFRAQPFQPRSDPLQYKRDYEDF